MASEGMRKAIAALEEELGGVKRELGWMKRGCIIHVQGSKALERLHSETIEAADGGGFPAFKRRAGDALAKESAQFLGYEWPTARDWTVTRGTGLTSWKSLWTTLSSRG